MISGLSQKLERALGLCILLALLFATNACASRTTGPQNAESKQDVLLKLFPAENAETLREPASDENFLADLDNCRLQLSLVDLSSKQLLSTHEIKTESCEATSLKDLRLSARLLKEFEYRKQHTLLILEIFDSATDSFESEARFRAQAPLAVLFNSNGEIGWPELNLNLVRQKQENRSPAQVTLQKAF